jgi:hypothetical protein
MMFDMARGEEYESSLFFMLVGVNPALTVLEGPALRKRHRTALNWTPIWIIT